MADFVFIKSPREMARTLAEIGEAFKFVPERRHRLFKNALRAVIKDELQRLHGNKRNWDVPVDSPVCAKVNPVGIEFRILFDRKRIMGMEWVYKDGPANDAADDRDEPPLNAS